MLPRSLMPGKAFAFSTYATYWIRCAIWRAIMNESPTIRLPTDIWPAAGHLARAQTALWQQNQREPSSDELAEAMQCAKEQVLLLLHLQYVPISLEQPVSSEHEVKLVGDQLAAPDETEQREQQQEVAELLTHLSPRERRGIPTRHPPWQTTNPRGKGIPLPATNGRPP